MEVRYTYDLATGEKYADVQGLRTPGVTDSPITAAVTLKEQDSGGIWGVDCDATFAITLPSPTRGRGMEFEFVVTDAGSGTVTIVVSGAAATFIGFIQIDDATVVATGATLTFVASTAVVGDTIIIRSLGDGTYAVKAFAAASGGITIAA